MSEKARSVVNSEAAFARAKKLFPGGVNAPGRAFAAVGGVPIFVKAGEGPRITDIDGNVYIDFVMSHGPLIAGHCNEQVMAAVSKMIGRGTSFGLPTEYETQLAAKIESAIESIEMIRFVNSGAEATLTALRLARAATGREKIIKCDHANHGHVDGTTSRADGNSSSPACPGVPRAVAESTQLIPFNDLDAARAAFESNPGQIAALLIEPIAGTIGVIPPKAGYLAGLRELCDQHGAILIFDEVLTGFRVAWGGAQTLYGVKPDLTCLGRIIGGGMPVGAVGGAKKLLSLLAPEGVVFQAGTLSGNPLAMAGGLATLEILEQPESYPQLEQRSAELTEALLDLANDHEVPLVINRVGSMMSLFFVDDPAVEVVDLKSARRADPKRFATFFNAMLDAGVLLPPDMNDPMFVSLAHDEKAIDETLKAAKGAFKAVRASLAT